MTRQELIDEIIETLGEQNGCGTLSRVFSRIMYVQSNQSEGAEPTDNRDEDETSGGGTDPCYTPALVLYAVPVEPEEDSGEDALGAPEYVVPLLRADPTKG